MKRPILVLALLLPIARTAGAQPVYIPDPGLKAAIEAALGVSDPTPTQMLALTYLSAEYAGISSLVGLEYATNLTSLFLRGNQISSVAPLAALTKLTYLNLDMNLVSNIAPLTGLTNLVTLYLYGNPISDFSPLAGLTRLTDLSLANTQLSSLNSLAGLTNLSSLILDENQISSVTPLTELTCLERLYLSDNLVADIPPLVELMNLTYLDLRENALNSAAYSTYIPLIQENNPGVELYYDAFAIQQPTASTQPAISIGMTSAALRGTVTDDGGEACQYRFRYKQGPVGVYSYTPWSGSVTTGQPFSQSITGLLWGSMYYFNAQARNSAGEGAWGNEQSFGTMGAMAYTLTISATSGGTVTQPGVGSYVYDAGTSVPVLAVPASPNVFVRWTGTAVDAGKVANWLAASTSVLVDADYTLVANFGTATGAPTVETLDATEVTSGSATLRGRLVADGGEACEYMFTYYPAGADDGSWLHTPWRCCKSTGETFSEQVTGLELGKVYFFYCSARNSAGYDYGGTRSFVTTSQRALTITCGPGGSVVPGPGTHTYAEGADVSLTATAAAGYRFTGWSGSIWSTSNPLLITMDSDYDVQANFEATDVPEELPSGSSLGEHTFDDPGAFAGEVWNNNYQHLQNPQYRRLHVQWIGGQAPDPAGMMWMRNLEDLDPASATYGEVVLARAKMAFDSPPGDRVLVRFSYLFESDAPGLELVAYLSDTSEMLDSDDPLRDTHYVEIGRVAVPPADCPGAIASRRFGTFEQWVSTGSLDLREGAWVELELVQYQVWVRMLPSGRTGLISAASAGSAGGSASIDDVAVEVHCDGICLDLNWSDTADEEDFLLIIASAGREVGLDEDGVRSRYCLDGTFSSDGYIDSYDVHSWDWSLADPSRAEGGNYCRVPLPLVADGPAGSGRYSSSAVSAVGLTVAAANELPGELLILGKSRRVQGLSDLLADSFLGFDGSGTYVGNYTAAGLSGRGNMRVVQGPADHVCVIHSERGVLQIDGTVQPIIPPGQASYTAEPRYGVSATVYVGIQGQGPDCFGRPILDAGFDAQGNAYIAPVVVQPAGHEPYVAAAKLQFHPGMTPPYQVAQLYDDPPALTDNQYGNYLREVELDAAGNLYVLNAHRLNESCILWKYSPQGEMLRRLNLTAPGSLARVEDPLALHVSRDGQMLYLASGQRQATDPDNCIIRGFDTGTFSVAGSIVVQGVQQVTALAEDPSTGTLWAVGFSLYDVPKYPDPRAEPFYVPYLAEIPPLSAPGSRPQAVTAAAAPLANPGTHNLALPLSLVWTGAGTPAADPHLVAFYDFEGSVNDKTGHGANGTLLNGARLADDRARGAVLALDGTAAYVDCGNPRNWPAGKAPRTLCAWAKTDTVTPGWREIAAYGSPALGGVMFIGMNGTDVCAGGYGDNMRATGFWGIGVWHHICLTYDGAKARLYADGIELGWATKTWNLTPTIARIGRQVDGSNEYWDGMIDNVRLYDRVLSPSEISALYHAEKPE